MIQFHCPTCHKLLHVDDSQAGHHAKCHCQTVIVVPGVATASPTTSNSDQSPAITEGPVTCPVCQRMLRLPPGFSPGSRIKCPCGKVLSPGPTPVANNLRQVGQSTSTPKASVNDSGWFDELPTTANPMANAMPPASQFQHAAPQLTRPNQPHDVNPYSAAAQSHLAEAAQQSQPNNRPSGSFALEASIINGSVLSGVIAMTVAVVWFVVGLMGGIIFFYPPILFIIGFVGLVKGLASR